jgi:two-component system, sensor histidine kinase and response regulator
VPRDSNPLNLPASGTATAAPCRSIHHTRDRSRAARLSEASRRRDEALASAAHELKTPLGIIAGYIDLLLSERPGSVSKQQRQILEESRQSCARLQRFVQSFLTFSALETGNTRMHFETRDLNQCLLEIYDYWLPQLAAKPLAFYFLPGDRLRPFEFDYDKVQHIVSNLVDNALKFTPAGGSVWLATGPHVWERRSHQKPGIGQERRKGAGLPVNSARVTVADSGPGVEPEYQQEIFDDFVQLPHEGSKGTGLGLAIARRLVQAHRGKIWVDSVPGNGAKFSFLLPFRPL